MRSVEIGGGTIAALVALMAAPCRGDELRPSFRHESYVSVAPSADDDVTWTRVLWVDRDLLHVEARYGYEGEDIATVLGGLHFAGGSTLTYDVHLALGLSAGATSGGVVAYRAELVMGVLDVSSEGELFVDWSQRGEAFFFTWTELGWSPLEWLRVGGTIQRTRFHQSPRDVDAGPFAGLSSESIDVALYLFGLGTDEPDGTVLIGVSF
ncbi:hypothetical protein [Sandaracinus amylolyticus]|uniref:hypothetical protein n=1 Tax=Sandaracinus amylolyticus TaxID=927083 RepID=UPI001F19D87F|nr:hypothetical protein [Sandaracinus amylolyticus]UJR86156.1 Hypothetical protein I5071_82380 [Sandaracinus amylolyticus]